MPSTSDDSPATLPTPAKPAGVGGETKQKYLDTHEDFLKSAGGPDWLSDLRTAAIHAFDQQGLPGPRDEAWRHTNIRPLMKQTFGLAGEAAAAEDLLKEYQFGEESAAEIVVVNGRVDAGKSNFGNLPDGVRLLDLIDAAEQHPKTLQPHLAQHADITASPFVALATAYLTGGVFLHVPAGVMIDQTIHILHVHTSAEQMATPRVLILAGDKTKFSVTETYTGPAGATYFTNAITEIVAGEDCDIDHNKLNAEGDAALHVATMETDIGARTVFADHSCTIGGKLTRNDLNVHMNGEEANAVLNGVAILTGEQHCDNHTLLDHQYPNCPSYELYKHVLDDKASGIFKGQIFVHQRAQKTDSTQNSRSLLLSDDAQMNSQPALEIYADDVKCTHGSTTGPLDDGAVFYLNSRGVSTDTANRLLTYAFAADVTRRIKVAPVRQRVEDYMAKQHGLPTDFRIQDLAEAQEDVVF